MSLIATARLLDDQRFLWRVKGAAISIAYSKINDEPGVDQWFAKYVLDNPAFNNTTLVALVAMNPAIATAVTVDEHDTVNSEGVPDNDILYVVGQVWTTAATRWDETGRIAALPPSATTPVAT